MSVFSGYEQYCLAFRDKEKSNLAELVYYSRCWLSTLADTMVGDDDYFGTDGLKFGGFPCEGKDALSSIISDTQSAAAYISKNLRTKLVRENSLLPVYQVKEINSAGMNWISRRPGRNVREKLSGSSTILGVHKRMSVDTGENRLFVSFLRRVSELCEIKSSSMPSGLCCDEETDFVEQFTPFLRSDEVAEIARWENLPPNNTLLSDRYYRCIWNGWTRLRSLDELVARDCENIDRILTTIVFWKIFSDASGIYSFPQTPVKYDYDSFTVKPAVPRLNGISADKMEIILLLGENGINILVNNSIFTVEVSGTVLNVLSGRKPVFSEAITASGFTKTMQRLIRQLGLHGRPIRQSHRTISADSVIVSPYTDIPYVAADNGRPAPLGFNIAVQTYDTGEANKVTLSLAESRVFCADNASSISSLYSCRSYNDAYAIFSDIAGRIISRQFCFLFPDVMNEFRLSPVRRVARVFYKRVEAVPQSIGAIFSCEGSGWFAENYTDDTLFLIVDIVDTQLTITPIKGSADSSPDMACSDRPAVVWERYPTATYSIYDISSQEKPRFEEIPVLVDLYSAKLSDQSRRTPLLHNGNWVTMGDVDDSGYAVNIEKWLTEYKTTHSWIAGSGSIKVISLTDRLLPLSPEYSVLNIGMDECVAGCQRCMRFSQQTGKMLWKDHLPDLSIKQPLSRFDLVKKQTVEPLNDTEIKIPLDNNHFILPAGQEKYSFELIQEEANSSMNYHAVLEHSAFPLKKPVECRLDMTYRYGADTPYVLTFIPLNSREAGFAELKTQWIEETTDHSVCDRVYPEFPAAADISLLHNYPAKSNDELTSDLFERVTASFSPDLDESCCSYHFTHSEHWKNDKKTGASYCYLNITHNGEVISVQLYDNDNVLRSENEVFFKIFIPKGKDFYRAKDICRNRSEYISQKMHDPYYLISGRFMGAWFGLSAILNGGRSVDADGFPEMFTQAVRSNIGNVWEAYRMMLEMAHTDERITWKEVGKVLVILCLLFEELGDDFYEYLLTYVDSGRRKDYVYLNSSIAYAIGPCTTMNQQKLFRSIAGICNKNPSKGFNMLSRAIWRNPHMIFNADIGTLTSCLKKAVNLIEELSEACRDGNDAVTGFLGRCHVNCCLEFILGMFRLRASEDDSVREMLRCDSPIIGRLREALYTIAGSQNDNLFANIRQHTFVRLNSQNNTTGLPDLLYAVMLYAAGDLNGDSIIIYEDISEEE